MSSHLLISSRGVDVPATFVSPILEGGFTAPLVVMAHGHGGTRDEAGGFTRVANELAQQGIASIRIDFPGCGESSESFTENNLANMLEDFEAALMVGLLQPGIDPRRTALLGYSMGGRVAMLFGGRNPEIDAMVLWAPVGSNGPDVMFSFVGGEAAYREHRSHALATGSTNIVTPWGQKQQLGAQWFVDLETLQPLTAMASYSGPLMVLHGANDTVIEPAVGVAVQQSAASRALAHYEVIAGADHGLGFYSDADDVSSYVVATSVDYLVANLMHQSGTRQ